MNGETCVTHAKDTIYILVNGIEDTTVRPAKLTQAEIERYRELAEHARKTETIIPPLHFPLNDEFTAQ